MGEERKQVQGKVGMGHGASLAIVVMGVSGSGKSSLGAALADRLGCAFLEGDAFHSPCNVAKMRDGIALTDADRWPWLDRLGAALGAAVARDGVAVAACSALRRSYRQRLAAAARRPIAFILLNASAGELQRRLGARPGHYMPASLLESQLQTLEWPAVEEGALVLESSAPVDGLCDQALTWLGAKAL